MSDFTDIESRPRILCSTFAAIPGNSGVASRLLERLPQLVLDYEIDVVCLRDENQPHLEKYAGCKIYRVSATEKNLVNQIKVFRRAIKRLLEGGDYDIVHYTDAFAGSELLDNKSHYGYRTVFEVTALSSWQLREIPYDLPENAGSKMLEALKRDERSCIKNSDIILTGTEITRELLIKRGGKPETTFKLAGGGVLGEFLRDMEKADPPMLIHLGSHAPWYDFTTLLDACEKLAKKHKFTLLMVGQINDKITPKLVRGIERRGLQDIATINQAVEFDEVPPLLQRASIGVIPLEASKRALEGGVVPRKFYEYLAAALPVVCADTPAVRELSNNGKDILLYKIGNARDLAAKLASLLSDAQKRNEYAFKSLKMHKSQFNPDIGAAILRRVYSALSRRKPITQNMFKLEKESFKPVKEEGSDKVYMDMPSFEELAQDEITRDLIKHEKEVDKEFKTDGDATPGVKPSVNLDKVDTEVTPITKRPDTGKLPLLDIESVEAKPTEKPGGDISASDFPLPPEEALKENSEAKSKPQKMHWELEPTKEKSFTGYEDTDIRPPNTPTQPEKDEELGEPHEVIVHPPHGGKSKTKPSKTPKTPPEKVIAEFGETTGSRKRRTKGGFSMGDSLTVPLDEIGKKKKKKSGEDTSVGEEPTSSTRKKEKTE